MLEVIAALISYQYSKPSTSLLQNGLASVPKIIQWSKYKLKLPELYSFFISHSLSRWPMLLQNCAGMIFFGTERVLAHVQARTIAALNLGGILSQTLVINI